MGLFMFTDVRVHVYVYGTPVHTYMNMDNECAPGQGSTPRNKGLSAKAGMFHVGMEPREGSQVFPIRPKRPKNPK